MSGLQGSDPFFFEDWPLVEQAAFFSGWGNAKIDQNWWTRPYPGLVTALLAPLLGIVSSALFMNWLSWAVSAWATWRLSQALFRDDLSAFLAVLFICAGMGFVFHIGDYSAHPPGFACYFVGVYLLFTRSIPLEARPLGDHLLMGAFLGVACLVYTWAGLILAIVYSLSALRLNRWLYIAAACVLTVAPMLLWKSAVGAMGVELTKLGTEQDHFKETLESWLWRYREQSMQGFLIDMGNRVLNIGWFDSPGVIVLGVLACVILPRFRSLRNFGVLLIATPIVAAFLLLSNGDMRGYLTYGISIWLYCWLARMLALGLRGQAWLRGVTAIILAAIFVTHFGSAGAHFCGWLGPTKTFIGGWDVSRVYFKHRPATVMSMTGMEKTPALFGGSGSLEEGGAGVTPQTVPIASGTVSGRRAMVAQAPLFAFLGLIGILAVNTWRARLAVIVVTAFAPVGFAWLSKTTFKTMPNYVNSMGWPWPRSHEAAVQPPFVLLPGATLRYHAELSAEFIDALQCNCEPDDDLRCFVGVPSVFLFKEHGPAVQAAQKNPAIGPGGAFIQVVASTGGVAIPIRANTADGIFIALDPGSAITAMRQAKQFTIEVTNHLEDGVEFTAWQRQGLPARDVKVTPPDRAVVKPPGFLPSIEIRLVRPDGSLKLAGF